MLVPFQYSRKFCVVLKNLLQNGKKASGCSKSCNTTGGLVRFKGQHSDDGGSVVSEDSEDDLLSAGDDDDETNENMNDPSPVNSPGARTSGEDEMSDGSEEESDSDDSTESSDTVTQSTCRGRNGQVWAATCPPPSRTRACNIRHTREGPVGNAKDIKNEVDAFTCFIDEDMLKQVVKHTNNRARWDLRAKGKNSDEWAPVDLCKIRGIVGLLYLIGVYRSQHESLRSLWSSGPSGRAIFPASFGRNRFEQLVANLRFDSREDRNTDDKFAPFRRMWEQFVENCRKCYVVSAFVTVDKQLIPFRGCCSFKQYMPSKPDKYGMKLFLLCDCLTGNTFNRKPYFGRQGNQRNVGLASDGVKILSSPLHFSEINITTDNSFTSSQLAADLLQKQITLLGTMRKNRRELPYELATGKRRSVGSSLFGFSERQTLVLHVPKKNKAVVLLSTMHNDKKVDEETGLLEMILDYNATKAAVDRVNKNVRMALCSTHTDLLLSVN